MTENTTIDDIMPDPETADYVSIIECTECGEQGHLYSSGRPRDEYQWWNCDECTPDEPVKHDIVLTTDQGATVGD